ncbi:MAG: GWxTD domain-containing protein [Bacteroidetes bacterium]|nr:GWxTD domain-containing protein [Bacteroidota bacterium]
MKKLLLLSLYLFVFSLNHLEAKKLNAFFSYSSFVSPTDGPYLETYLSVIGNSATYILNDGKKFQSTIEITLLFKQGETIKNFKKYNLKSPEVIDSSSISFNFIDQQRITLPNGNYLMEIIISDINNNKSVFNSSDSVIIDFPPVKTSISGIQLVESYKKTENPSIISKSGFDLMPYPSNFIPQSVSKLAFYSEIYNTDKSFKPEEKFIINSSIESFESKKNVGSFFTFKKGTPTNVIPILNEFDIKELPSGNYYLVVEVRDKDNSPVAINKLFFQRSNPNLTFDVNQITSLQYQNTFVDSFKNADLLLDFINCLYPISSEMERNYETNQMKKADITTMKQFFLNFWINRNSSNPEKAWYTYYEEVMKVNNSFKTRIKKGYMTDRGRVYLQYGPPNTITKSDKEPNAYPYEIWHYYTLNNQRNKKFVFYNPDLVTNDYELIHSDAIGEMPDPAWQKKITKRTTPNNNLDDTKGINHWGNETEENFSLPK